MATPPLVIDDACRTFGDTRALDRVSLTVEAGECVALVGESGSGKSTLLRACNATVVLDSGRIRVAAEDLRAIDPVRLRRRLGYVPQDGGLLPHWTVRRNAALVPMLLGEADAAERADAMLERVGLPPARFADRWPSSLSGGQRQRVALARALAGSPALILLDEPFGALDALTRADVQAVFDEVRRSTGVAALLVTHDLHEAARLAGRIAVMRNGRLEQVAPPDVLCAAPATPYVAALLERARLTGQHVS